MTEQFSMSKTALTKASQTTSATGEKNTSNSKTNSKLDEHIKKKTENSKQNKQRSTTKRTEKMVKSEPTKRVITQGELIASISSAAQAGVLGTLLLCLTILGFLCSKGVLSLNFANAAAVYPMPKQLQVPTLSVKPRPKQSQRKVQKAISETKSSHKETKVKELRQKHETTERKHTATKLPHKQTKQTKSMHKNHLKTTRELTWKTRTCFTVDETDPPKKENVLLKILNKATNNNPIQESKRGQTYLKSPSAVEITIA